MLDFTGAIDGPSYSTDKLWVNATVKESGIFTRQHTRGFAAQSIRQAVTYLHGDMRYWWLPPAPTSLDL